MELPLAPRSPAAVSHRLDDPTHKRNWILGISRCDPTSGQRDMGMPPSVAGARLAIAPLQAMKKRPSHRPLAPFPTDCCAKNTQFGRTPVTLLRRRCQPAFVTQYQTFIWTLRGAQGTANRHNGPVAPTAINFCASIVQVTIAYSAASVGSQLPRFGCGAFFGPESERRAASFGAGGGLPAFRRARGGIHRTGRTDTVRAPGCDAPRART